MSGGVALFDYDGDGRVDIYLVDSLTVDTARDPRAARSALFRNAGGGRFEDVTDKAGVGAPRVGHGRLHRGLRRRRPRGPLRDRDVPRTGSTATTATAPSPTWRRGRASTGGGWSAGCGFADYDRDGDLDLFVSRYVKFDLAQLPEFGKGKSCNYRGIPVQCGPRGLPGEGDFLYRNDGGGRFTEVGAKAGVADPRAYFGLGIAWLDFDEDGWLDLFVANDSGPNYLYRNQKDGTFKDVAFPTGVAVSEDGGEQGSMGVAVGDYDHSGRLSLFVTNFAEEYNALYRSEGASFADASFRSKTAPSSLPLVGWGTAFLDYDNDTWLDLVAVNGHVYPQLDAAPRGASAGYRQRKLLYRNLGDGTFDEVGPRAGREINEERVSRGLAIGDLDDDGGIDVVINDLDGSPQVLRNEAAGRGHWLLVKLAGAKPNTTAIGARIVVTAGGVRQVRLVQSGTSYLSQDDRRQHFGLGAAAKAERVEVRWPDGTATTLTDVAVDRVLEIAQK